MSMLSLVLWSVWVNISFSLRWLDKILPQCQHQSPVICQSLKYRVKAVTCQNESHLFLCSFAFKSEGWSAQSSPSKHLAILFIIDLLDTEVSSVMYDPLNSCVILSPVRDPCSCCALSVLPKRQPYLASLSGQRTRRSIALSGHFDVATCHGWQCRVFRVAQWVLFTRTEACGGNVSRTIVAKESSIGD